MENKKRSSLLHLHDFQMSTVSPWRFGVFWILTKSRNIRLRKRWICVYIYIYTCIYIYKYMAKMCQRGMFHLPLTASPTGKKTNYYKLLQTVVCFRMRCGIMFSLCLWYDLLGKKQHKKDPFDERGPRLDAGCQAPLAKSRGGAIGQHLRSLIFERKFSVTKGRWVFVGGFFWPK